MITESKILNRKLLKSGHKIDQSLLWMIVLMSAFSLMMIYLASIAYAAHDGGDQWFYLGRQAIFFEHGRGRTGLVAAKIPMARWKKWTPWILLFSLFLLVVVLFAGREINGAKRWIHLGPVNLQPTEIFRIGDYSLFGAAFSPAAPDFEAV